MRPTIFVVLLALGRLGAAIPDAVAQAVSAAPADTTVVETPGALRRAAGRALAVR